MKDTNSDPEELLQQARERSRTDDPAPTPDDQSKPLDEAVADAFARDVNSTISFRDQKLAALFAALDETDELATVVSEAADKLDRDVDDAGKSEALRLLVRVGLQTVDEDVVEAGRDGYREYQLRQADEF